MMDLNFPARVPFNTWVAVHYYCRPKASSRDIIVRELGKDYYNLVMASSVPFVMPIIYERFRVFIITYF